MARGWSDLVRAGFSPVQLGVRWLLLIPFTLCGLASAQDWHRDKEFLNGLREQRLYALAEHFCEQRLQLANQADLRGKLIVEQIRNYATHAMNTGSTEQAGLWNQAQKLAERYLQRYPRHTRRLVVQFQYALAMNSRFESTPATEPLAKRVGIIREAVRELERVSRQVKRAQPVRRDGLNEEELHSLQNHVELRLAKTLLSQARLYSPKSADRQVLVNQARERLNKMNARLGVKDRLKTPVRIELSISRRLAGQAVHAQRLLRALMSMPSLTSEQRNTIMAEQIRTELAVGNVDGALNLARQKSSLDGPASPDRELASLEAVLGKWRAEGGSQRPQQSDRWKKLALDFVRRIDDQHGPYWGRRADQILIGAIPRGSVSTKTDIEILLRAADNQVRKQNLTAALGAYERAAEAAAKVNSDELRFRALFLAARVLQQQQKPRAFFLKLRSLAMELKKVQQAPTAHLLAVRQAYSLAGNAKGIALYQATLHEHLREWPGSMTVGEVAWRLGRLQQVNRRWSQAAEAYQKIPAGHAYEALAIPQLTTCWLALFERAKQQQKSVKDKLATAVQWLRNRYLVDRGGQTSLPATWNLAARAAVLGEAKIRLVFGGQAEGVGKSLAVAHAGLPAASPAWLAQAEVWLVAAAAAEQDWATAKRLSAKVSAAFPNDALRLLGWLSQSSRSNAVRRGQLMSGVADHLTPLAQKWSPQQQQQLALYRAEALQLAGKLPAAITAYRKLARQHSRSALHQRRFAQALLQSSKTVDLKEGLAIWRRLARFSRAGTERWFLAKYSIALSEYKLGNKKRAAQLIQFMQATPPGFSRSKLKDQFLALLKKCQG